MSRRIGSAALLLSLALHEARAQEEAAFEDAPWRPALRWSDHEVPAEALRMRIGLGLGGTTNHFRLSEDERLVQEGLVGGAQLAGDYPIWPSSAFGGPLVRPSLDVRYGAHLAGAPTFAALTYAPTLPLFGWDAQSHPFRLAVQRTLVEGGDAGTSVWISATWLENPLAWDRPLPVEDGALHDSSLYGYDDGVRVESGFELGAGIGVGPAICLGPSLRLVRADYPDALANWDATEVDAGLAFGLHTGLLRLEARGGFASSVARGDWAGSTARETDASWVGSRWGLVTALDADGMRTDPWFAELRASLLHRDFRTGDALDASHFGRLDLGGIAALGGGYAPDLGGRLGLGFGLSYEIAWNATNLDTAILPIDANDYVEQRFLLQVDAAL